MRNSSPYIQASLVDDAHDAYAPHARTLRTRPLALPLPLVPPEPCSVSTFPDVAAVPAAAGHIEVVHTAAAVGRTVLLAAAAAAVLHLPASSTPSHPRGCQISIRPFLLACPSFPTAGEWVVVAAVVVVADRSSVAAAAEDNSVVEHSSRPAAAEEAGERSCSPKGEARSGSDSTGTPTQPRDWGQECCYRSCTGPKSEGLVSVLWSMGGAITSSVGPRVVVWERCSGDSHVVRSTGGIVFGNLSNRRNDCSVPVHARRCGRVRTHPCGSC